MKKYESIVVFRPDMEDASREELLERFKGVIERYGSITSVDDWGIKRLAYDIEKVSDGYYYLLNFEASEDLPKELERNYKISDQVLRYNVIRKSE
ncbi:MAG TPA: 30S ribosomal protein S6 [Tissierellia bacterium]|jgi:small subunit ribosomal protein S6|nr:30S ribosomal protein S6 [Tissierellia bacterium]